MNTAKQTSISDYDIEKMLAEEKARYIQCEMILRQIRPTNKGQSVSPPEELIDLHLQACRDYYSAYGTIKGERSPWILAIRSE